MSVNLIMRAGGAERPLPGMTPHFSDASSFRIGVSRLAAPTDGHVPIVLLAAQAVRPLQLLSKQVGRSRPYSFRWMSAEAAARLMPLRP